MKKIVPLLLFFLPFIACKKNNPPELPRGYISADFNGNNWKSTEISNPAFILKRHYPKFVYEPDLTWKLKNWFRDYTHITLYISFNAPFPIAPGKYYFNNKGIETYDQGVAALIQGWEIISPGNLEEVNYYSTDGYVQITHTNDEYVEGIFNFTAKNPKGNIINVENGNFKAYIIKL